MKIQEVCHSLNLTKKAIYYYEKQGLLSIHKDHNGYRVFDECDIERLHEISLYRKMDIEISQIKKLIERDQTKKKELLNEIYKQKQNELHLQESYLNQLQHLISHNQSFQELDEQIDYLSIAKAIQEQVPGLYGEMFIQHFTPYLQGTIQTKQQQSAYHRIIHFWDEVDLQIPWSLRFIHWINRHDDQSLLIFQQTEKYKTALFNDKEAYHKTKELMEAYYQKSHSLMFQLFHYPQRKLKIRLQNIGYNDIFLPAMCELSPEYKSYSQTIQELNTKVCQDLGLYYDQKMRLCKKS